MEKKITINNDREPIGKITIKERDEIKLLFERKNGLTELFKSLSGFNKNDIDFLYEKLVTDMGVVSTKFQNWWTEKSKKYNWESKDGYKWEVDFDTSEVFCVKQ